MNMESSCRPVRRLKTAGATNVVVRNNPDMADLFYDYYDHIVVAKDYAREIEYIMTATGRWAPISPQSILELGCGTGNHTWELAKMGMPITALDIDEKMITRAKTKLKLDGNSHVEFHHGPIGSLGRGHYDMALALFNVVNYILDENDLEE